MPAITDEQLLAELDDLVRTLPTREVLKGDSSEGHPWLGRAITAIRRWDRTHEVTARLAVDRLLDFESVAISTKGYRELNTLLHQARADLQMEVGRGAVVIPQGQVYEYFDEVRKRIEVARAEVFFVDPYMDADFVERYMPFVADGVAVRLLAKDKKNLSTLVPAAKAYMQQHPSVMIEVRSSQVHDRYLFVDHTEGHVSGASFKDGARKAPALLIQLYDGLGPMLAFYEALWGAATIEL